MNLLRRYPVATGIALILILMISPAVLATHSWTGYPAYTFTTTMTHGGNYSLSMWKYTYYGHNTTSSLQLRDTSHWSRLNSSTGGPVEFAMFNTVENYTGYIVPVEQSYYIRTIGVGQQINVNYPYNGGAGITVNKGPGAVWVATTTRETIAREMMQRVTFAPGYTCYSNFWGAFNTYVSGGTGNC